MLEKYARLEYSLRGGKRDETNLRYTFVGLGKCIITPSSTIHSALDDYSMTRHSLLELVSGKNVAAKKKKNDLF